MKAIIFCLSLKGNLRGVGRACKTWVILEISRLLATQTRPMGVMFLWVQFCTINFIDSSLFSILRVVIFIMFLTSYSIPKAVKLLTSLNCSRNRIGGLPEYSSSNIIY